MNEREWLDSLKAGDEIYVAGNYGAVGTINRIARTTDTQIIVEKVGAGAQTYEKRYRRKDGRLVGASTDPWCQGHIAPVTDDRREAIEKMRLRHIIDKTSWKDVSVGQLRRIVTILKGEP